jgi:biopolymer transport protein ExbB
MFSPMALQQMWNQAWPIISVLLACSVISGAVILERWVSLTRAGFNREAVMNKLRKMLTENRLDQAIAYVENIRKPVGRVMSALLTYVQQNRAADRERVERLTSRLIRAETSNLSRYLTGLGTIGSVSPFVGLLGTVVGIIAAFRAISENSGGGPGVVANGIAEALITTALGLFVAIPAVVSYNLYIRKIEQISEDIQLSTDEVTDLLNLR